MVINFYFAFILLFLIFVMIPTLTILFIKNDNKIKLITMIIFIFYIIFLLIGTTVELDTIYPNLSFHFEFNHNWFSSYFLWANFSLDNLIINICLMFPVGIFTYTHLKKHMFLKTIFIALLLSIIIELYQMILPIYRNTEILDIILNTISGLFSAIYYNFVINLSKINHFSLKNKKDLQL